MPARRKFRIRMHEVVDFGAARGTSVWRFSTDSLHPCTEAAESLAAAGVVFNDSIHHMYYA